MKDKKNLLEKNKKEEGITLVALVIIVIIMLILAAVSISAVIGGEGLFSKIRQATEIYENAVEGEEDKIQNLMNQVDRYIENPSNPILKEPAVIGTVVFENQTFDGRLKGTYNNPIIPKGFAPINENGADWGTEEGYKYGLVITDEITGNESTGNEFVWVPVDGEIVKFERYDFGKMSSKITSFNELTETLPTALTESVKK